MGAKEITGSLPAFEELPDTHTHTHTHTHTP